MLWGWPLYCPFPLCSPAPTITGSGILESISLSTPLSINLWTCCPWIFLIYFWACWCLLWGEGGGKLAEVHHHAKYFFLFWSDPTSFNEYPIDLILQGFTNNSSAFISSIAFITVDLQHTSPQKTLNKTSSQHQTVEDSITDFFNSSTKILYIFSIWVLAITTT